MDIEISVELYFKMGPNVARILIEATLLNSWWNEIYMYIDAKVQRNYWNIMTGIIFPTQYWYWCKSEHVNLKPIEKCYPHRSIGNGKMMKKNIELQYLQLGSFFWTSGGQKAYWINQRWTWYTDSFNTCTNASNTMYES